MNSSRRNLCGKTCISLTLWSSSRRDGWINPIRNQKKKEKIKEKKEFWRVVKFSSDEYYGSLKADERKGFLSWRCSSERFASCGRKKKRRSERRKREKKRQREASSLCASARGRKKRREWGTGRFHGKRHFSSEIPEGLLTRRARHEQAGLRFLVEYREEKSKIERPIENLSPRKCETLGNAAGFLCLPRVEKRPSDFTASVKDSFHFVSSHGCAYLARKTSFEPPKMRGRVSACCILVASITSDNWLFRCHDCLDQKFYTGTTKE